MGYVTRRGRLKISASTLRSLKRKVTSIDRRLAGRKGMTKSGRVIKNPRSYVFGGVRKHLK
jgi:hypothetical protein